MPTPHPDQWPFRSADAKFKRDQPPSSVANHDKVDRGTDRLVPSPSDLKRNYQPTDKAQREIMRNQSQSAHSESGFEYTNNWFGPIIPVWDRLIPKFRPKKILEIGSFEGRSTVYLIEKCADTADIQIHCVDTWEGGIEHQSGQKAEALMNDVEKRFKKNTSQALRNSKNSVDLVIHKKFSNIALAELMVSEQSKPFDLIYVDGSHIAPDVLTDAIMSFQLLRVGGLLIFDDYVWEWGPRGNQDLLNMPKLAIDSFVNVFKRKLRLISGFPIRQLYLEKLSD